MAKPETTRLFMHLALPMMVVIMAGCAPEATRIEAAKAGDYRRGPERLFVLSHVGAEFGEKFAESFQSKLIAIADYCGVEAEVSAVKPLELDKTVHSAQMSRFDPDTVLLLRIAGGTRDQYGIFHVIYDAELTDAATKKTVWRAKIEFYRGSDLIRVEERGEALAVELTNKMKQDGILRTCPAVKRKRRALVSQILADKMDYLTQNFSSEGLSSAIKSQLTNAAIPPKGFNRMRVVYDLTAEKSDGKRESQTVTTTIVDAENGYSQELSEFSFNNVPFALQYSLVYGGALPLKSQNVYLQPKRVEAIVESDQIAQFGQDLARGRPENGRFVYEYVRGSSGTANPTTRRFECHTGSSYAARTINAGLAGKAIDVDCDIFVNEARSSRQQTVFLIDYGIELRVSSETYLKVTDVYKVVSVDFQ